MKLFLLIWALGLIILAVVENERRPVNDNLPMAKASWTQPSGRLFAVCPNDWRNYEKSTERKA